jgi:hypothetical protein
MRSNSPRLSVIALEADMRRTINTLGSLLLVVGLGVVVSGCELIPDPEFAALESALTLRIVEVKRSASDASTDVRFELTNQGSTTAKACIGPSRSVSSKGSFWIETSGNFVSHPGCAREFTIPSGGAMAWHEALEVPGRYADRVEVEISVQIVNPQRCGGMGNCAAIYLKSNQFEIP